jgi:branched-chain amino acid transport system ATP-binding protein
MSCRENVEAGLAFHPGGAFGAAAHERARALLDRVGLGGRANDDAAALTYVDRKRLELARALALSPSLLLLDEWLAGLNPTELDDGIALVRLLAGEGVAVLLVEHVMDAVHALCARVVVMNAGRRIAEGPPAHALAHPEVVRAYLGDDAEAA